MVRESNLQRKRTFWSDEEDARLVELVEQYGIHNWPEVAGALQGRDSKSCSLRWRYFLAPHIIRSTDQKLSDWEVAVLVWAQREYGNKWRTIVDNYLPWRSPNDLKNYCNQYVNGKHNHVITQNKLLQKNVPLAALLAHPPPEVQERWRHVNSVRDSPKGQQRPVKKGTRGLSYIIRQAAKLKAQRTQPYPKPSTATGAGPAAPAAAAAAAAGTAVDGSYLRHMTHPVSHTGGSVGPSRIISLMGPAPAAAAAAAAAGAAVSYAPHYALTGLPSMSQGLPGSGSGSSSFTMQYSSLQSSYPSSSSGMQGMPANLSIGSMSMNMHMAQGCHAVAAAGASGPMQGSLPPSWCPSLDCSPNGNHMPDGGAGAMPFTPGSAASCFTPAGSFHVSMNAMNMSSMSMAPGSMNSMKSMSNSMGVSGLLPGCSSSAAAAAGPVPAPGGAFGQQGGGAGSSSVTCPPSQPQNHQIAACGSYGSMWQEAPEYACTNSFSSNSSGFAMDATGYLSPTNQSCMQHPQHYQQLPQHQQLQQCQQHQHMQQQQQQHPAGVCDWQTGMVAGLPQQLQPSFQQQQQQQQQHLLLDDAAARSSGTGTGTGCAAFPTPAAAAGASGAATAAAAAAAAAAGSPVDSIGSINIMGLAAVDDDELDDIVDLLDSESGDEFEFESSNCCQQLTGAGAAAGGRAAPAADAGVQASPLAAAVAAARAAVAARSAALARSGFEAAKIKLEAQPMPEPAAADHSAHSAAAAAAAAAATAQAGQLKSELHSMQLSETFSFDVPSSGGGAAVDAVLGMVAADDHGFDFSISSDDFDMLTAGW